MNCPGAWVCLCSKWEHVTAATLWEKLEILKICQLVLAVDNRYCSSGRGWLPGN